MGIHRTPEMQIVLQKNNYLRSYEKNIKTVIISVICEIQL